VNDSQGRADNRDVARSLFAVLLVLALASPACTNYDALSGRSATTLDELHDYLSLSVNRMTLEKTEEVVVDFSPAEGGAYALLLIPARQAGSAETLHFIEQLERLGYDSTDLVRVRKLESRPVLAFLQKDTGETIVGDSVEYSKPMLVVKANGGAAHLTVARRTFSEAEIDRTPPPAGVVVTELR
jgi:hypothetical protein